MRITVEGPAADADEAAEEIAAFASREFGVALDRIAEEAVAPPDRGTAEVLAVIGIVLAIPNFITSTRDVIKLTKSQIDAWRKKRAALAERLPSVRIDAGELDKPGN